VTDVKNYKIMTGLAQDAL